MSEVSRILEGTIDANDPGFTLAVIRDGEVVCSFAKGMADLAFSVPVTLDTVFDIASVSKQFTAASIVLLVEEGKLSVSDDVRMFVPELPDYGSKITVAHLLHHTSGIRDYTVLMSIGGYSLQNEYPERWVLALIARQKGLNFRPGEQFLYSNSGYFLLGVIVNRVSGQTLRQYANDHIFAPLHMTSTHFNDDTSEVVPKRAVSYRPSQKGSYCCISLLSIVGDGGVNSTVGDLARWAANFSNNKLGKADFIDAMMRVGVLNDGTLTSYACGLFVENRHGRHVVHHSGGFFGYRACLLVLPKEKLSVICLSCQGESVRPTRLVERIAFGDTVPATMAASAPGVREVRNVEFVPLVAQSFMGNYWSAELAATFDIRCSKDGKLFLNRPTDKKELLMEQNSECEFKVLCNNDDLAMTMTFDQLSSRASSFSVSSNRINGIEFIRM